MSFPRCGPAAQVTILGTIFAVTSIPPSVVKNTCIEHDNLAQVSWFYGPGVWGAWIVTTATVLVTKECDFSRKAVLSSSSLATYSDSTSTIETRRKDEEKGSNPEYGQIPSLPPDIDFGVIVATGYPLLAALDLIYRLSIGKRTAELEAAHAVACATFILVTLINCFSNHRTTWRRRFLWFLATYLSYTTNWSNISVQSQEPFGFGSISASLRCFCLFFQLPSIGFALDPQRRSQIEDDGMSLIFACFACYMFPFGLIYWIATRPSFQENEQAPCRTYQLTNVIPRTSQNLMDPVQAAVLCLALLNMSRSLNRWFKSR